jgi:hypothetical protein
MESGGKCQVKDEKETKYNFIKGMCNVPVNLARSKILKNFRIKMMNSSGSISFVTMKQSTIYLPYLISHDYSQLEMNRSFRSSRLFFTIFVPYF